MIVHIKVKITKIEVDERYYSFEWGIQVGSYERQEGYYSSDYCNGMSKEEFRDFLKEGEAARLALEDYAW